jgi:hypothetical protein
VLSESVVMMTWAPILLLRPMVILPGPRSWQ